MGSSSSKDPKQELTENGAVNSNFIVQESEYNVTKDVKIVLYLILVVLILDLAFKLYRAHKKKIERRVRRNINASLGSVAAV